MNSALPPSSSIAATTSAPRCSLLPVITTWAPSRASAPAVARPIPTSHQLQSARFPSRSFIRSSRHVVDGLVQNIPPPEWTVKSKPAKLILMTQAPVTEKGRATRERILQAAAELVAERGVAGMSLDDVRARTGTSRSQLYHYFDDRDDLVRAVIDVTTDAVLDVQGDLLDRLDSWAGIDRWFDALVALQEERQARGGSPIGSLAGQLPEHDPQARTAIAAGLERWETNLRDGLTRMKT